MPDPVSSAGVSAKADGRDERNARCENCGHTGDRVFALDAAGHWRDVLGGTTGLRADHCECSRCGDSLFEMVPADVC